MATEYLTTDIDLKKVADGIRSRTGKTTPIAFPDGYVTEIGTLTNTSDATATASDIAKGKTAYVKGAKVTGTMEPIALSAIAVSSSKTEYAPGDSFDASVLTVTASYTNGAAKVLSAGSYTVTAPDLSTAGEKTGSVRYTEGGVTKTDSFTVTVSSLKDNFADNDWASIIAACHSGSVPSTWVVGNSKTMTINGASYQVDIIGKNHDTYASGGKAPLTFQLHDCYGETKNMNSSNTNSGGWTSCAMRSTHLPAILALMPTEVQNGIREVNKLTSAGSQSATINTTADKLFLLSEIEIFGSVSYSNSGEGTQYDYYKEGNSKVKKFNGSAHNWWERSPYGGGSTYFCLVSRNGKANDYGASGAFGVAFGFCF